MHDIFSYTLVLLHYVDPCVCYLVFIYYILSAFYEYLLYKFITYLKCSNCSL